MHQQIGKLMGQNSQKYLGKKHISMSKIIENSKNETSIINPLHLIDSSSTPRANYSILQKQNTVNKKKEKSDFVSKKY